MTRAALGCAVLIAVALPLRAPHAEPPAVEEDYALHCSGCHRLDGTGTPGTVPSLHGLGPLLATPAGRAYLARVPGVAQAPLSDARAARLLNWVLARFSSTPPEPPYRADEVGSLRSAPLRDPVRSRTSPR